MDEIIQSAKRSPGLIAGSDADRSLTIKTVGAAQAGRVIPVGQRGTGTPANRTQTRRRLTIVAERQEQYVTATLAPGER